LDHKTAFSRSILFSFPTYFFSIDNTDRSTKGQQAYHSTDTQPLQDAGTLLRTNLKHSPSIDLYARALLTKVNSVIAPSQHKIVTTKVNSLLRCLLTPTAVVLSRIRKWQGSRLPKSEYNLNIHSMEVCPECFLAERDLGWEGTETSSLPLDNLSVLKSTFGIKSLRTSSKMFILAVTESCRKSF
jgi:hypothetical protein